VAVELFVGLGAAANGTAEDALDGGVGAGGETDDRDSDAGLAGLQAARARKAVSTHATRGRSPRVRRWRGAFM
jgi:hypothetical protein